MLVFVKLLITFSISMYIMCVMFVQRFEPRGRSVTHFQCYYFLHISSVIIFFTSVIIFLHISSVIIFYTFPVLLFFTHFQCYYFSHISSVIIFYTFPVLLFFTHFQCYYYNCLFIIAISLRRCSSDTASSGVEAMQLQ